MKGDQDSSRFRESLLCYGSVRLLVRRRDISPSLSLARERVAIQTFVPPSSTVSHRVFCDCTVVSFLRVFL